MDKNNIMVIGIIAVIAIFLFRGQISQQALVGGETVTRTAPSIVNPSERFVVTYVANVGTGTDWTIFLEDSVAGGCVFGDAGELGTGGSNELNAVWTHDSGTRYLIEVTAPASGSCSFGGQYQYVDISTSYGAQSLSILTVDICQDDCSDWSGVGPCETTMVNDCGTTCTRIVQKNSQAPDYDTDCNQYISKIELIIAIQDWLRGDIEKMELIPAIQAWLGGGI